MYRMFQLRVVTMKLLCCVSARARSCCSPPRASRCEAAPVEARVRLHDGKLATADLSRVLLDNFHLKGIELDAGHIDMSGVQRCDLRPRAQHRAGRRVQRAR